ncbi:MAG: hypothetical protein INR73_21155 [Williamsia sp.]|nr:hypothetical protein [Williamsia sp.]
MKKSGRPFWIAAGLCCFIFLFSQCLQEPARSHDPRGSAYAGSQRCADCHREIYQSYINTAHAASTRPASRQSIRGSFAEDLNHFVYHTGLTVRMQQKATGFYQEGYAHDTLKQAERFDIVVGSGRKAQTYLYWKGDQVFQLPVSYSVQAGSWVNSPNYPAHQVRFDRNIPVRCFECHASFIPTTATSAANSRLVDHFDKNRLVYGIDCERCHGPAAHHADFHQQHPQEREGRFISSIKNGSRQNKTELCALCHAGITPARQSTFSFQPGSPLNHYFNPDTTKVSMDSIDVHGNQYQLLRASACFRKSQVLDCSSCHNVHTKERDDLALFSSRCMTCHNEAQHTFCPLATRIGNRIKNNCIDCHMPSQPSRLITLLSQGQKKPTPDLIRTHYVAVYREETEKFLAEHK